MEDASVISEPMKVGLHELRYPLSMAMLGANSMKVTRAAVGCHNSVYLALSAPIASTARIAQSVERTTLNRVVVGSIPTSGVSLFVWPFSNDGMTRKFDFDRNSHLPIFQVVVQREH